MNRNKSFQKEFMKIAIPVALQGLLQSSFSMVDQIMVGQLGENSIAGIGLAGKFVSLYSVLLSAVAMAAGIMLAQFIGKKDEEEAGKIFYVNLGLSLLLAIVFALSCLLAPGEIMGIYTTDILTRNDAAAYLLIVSVGFLPRACSQLFSVLLRCRGAASVPLYATGMNAVLDTALSYILIFGKLGLPEMGVAGAAVGTVMAQIAEALVILISYWYIQKKEQWEMPFSLSLTSKRRRQYLEILIPILICEFFWSLGENVYGVIYGRIGTRACAAMTLISPMVVLFMGLMGGVSQAAGILMGKRLGAKEYDLAYKEAKKMLWYGLGGSLVLSLIFWLFADSYVRIYSVEREVQIMAALLLKVFAVMALVKVQNMILGGGIIRSGGKTNYVMMIDLFGTWCIGVPLGLVTAFVMKWPLSAVYFALSLEEVVRLLISFWIFHKRIWMEEL